MACLVAKACSPSLDEPRPPQGDFLMDPMSRWHPRRFSFPLLKKRRARIIDISPLPLVQRDQSIIGEGAIVWGRLLHLQDLPVDGDTLFEGLVVGNVAAVEVQIPGALDCPMENRLGWRKLLEGRTPLLEVRELL